MQHTYDLLLQPGAVGEPLVLGPVVAALQERGAQLSDDGRGTWRLPDGEVTVSTVLEDGAVRSLDVRVPFHDTAALFDATVRELTELAEKTGTRVMDPQRNEVVLAGASSDEYLRMARYAGEYGGVSTALGLTSYAAPPREDTGSLRWILMMAVFVVALYSGWRAITVFRESRAADAAERAAQSPRPVDGTPKVPGK
ncbi:MAG: hypothetical protein ACOZQL_16465 [Myxococcota bacterium]